MEGVLDWKASPYPSDDCSPIPDRYSDADFGGSSPASSNYSSCDGSDFDRYCSANSVLGSASICSSVGNYSEVREEPSEGYSSRRSSLRNHWNGYECFSDGGPETPRANGESSYTRINASSRLNEINGCSSSCYGRPGEDKVVNVVVDAEKYEKAGTFNEIVRNTKKETLSVFNIGTVIGIESQEDKLSESVDSVLDYETDNESITQLSEKSFKLVNENEHGDVNPLLMNSSTAFGSNDWDEFMEDSGGDGLALGSLLLGQSFQHQDDHFVQGFEKCLGEKTTSNYGTENLTVNDLQDSNYLSAINHDAQVVDVDSQFRVNKPDVLNCRGVDAVDLTAKDLECVSVLGSQNTLFKVNKIKCHLSSMPDSVERSIQSAHGKDNNKVEASDNFLKGESELSISTVLSHRAMLQSYCNLNGASEEIKEPELDDKRNCLLPLSKTGDSSSIKRDQGKDPSSPHLVKADDQMSEMKKLEIYDSYDEMVLEMEEILLDSRKCHGSMPMQTNQDSVNQQSQKAGDGSLVSSSMNGFYPPPQVALKIDRVEVIGAKQKKGDVSFGERLVGVREYTIYQIKVWSGLDEWMVDRRYRDFFTLYRQLKVLFSSRGLRLPSAWFSVEQESRKIFGNASPDVVMERSNLIEDCLRSILNSTFHFGTPSPLTMFLTPGKVMFKYGLLQSLVPQYMQKFAEDGNSDLPGACLKDSFLLGKTISLVVETKPHKSLRQLLELQHYTCAGCHKRLDTRKTLLGELAQTFGWNRPRFCEYTGQLFCASCHTNDTSVLPARVLHHWDFTKYPVSQLAKAYLESIYDQPMLCVSAVNPFLFSKVPALLHVMGLRKKIGAEFPYVKCPFKRSIQRSLGLRKHLLENNDFFALRDLVDLSKGPFAALPVMVENISDLILEHITQQCLVCYDSGVPCAAQQACHNPSSLIFPFQEAEAEKCTSCESVFHKACYGDLPGCPCSSSAATRKRYSLRETGSMGTRRESVGFLERSVQPVVAGQATGFFTNILTMVRSDKIWKPKNGSPVILMGSLPSSSTQLIPSSEQHL